MDLTKLQDEAKVDLETRIDDIGYVAKINAQLNSKWLRYYNTESLIQIRLGNDLNKLKAKRFMYYRFDHVNTMTKTEAEIMVEGDDEYIKLKERYEYSDQILRYIEKTCSNITSRGYDLKHALEYLKFQNGE